MNIGKIKARITAMLAKAKDTGATEAEALTSLNMAMKLSEQYGVNLADLENEQNKIEFSSYCTSSNAGKAWLHEVDNLLGNPISNFCDVKASRSWPNAVEDATITFFGLEADVLLATFVRDRLKATMDYEWGLWKRYEMEGKLTASMRVSFMKGFSQRITSRMVEFKAKTAHFSRDKHALTVRKEGLIAAEQKRRGLSYGKASKTKNKFGYHAQAGAAGAAAGNAADIGQATARNSNAGLLT